MQLVKQWWRVKGAVNKSEQLGTSLFCLCPLLIRPREWKEGLCEHVGWRNWTEHVKLCCFESALDAARPALTLSSDPRLQRRHKKHIT